MCSTLIGLLSSVLDPVGQGAEKVLSPVGNTLNAGLKPVTETVGGGLGPVVDTLMAPAKKGEQAGKISNAQNKPEKGMGGQPQTADNPLGL